MLSCCHRCPSRVALRLLTYMSSDKHTCRGVERSLSLSLPCGVAKRHDLSGSVGEPLSGDSAPINVVQCRRGAPPLPSSPLPHRRRVHKRRSHALTSLKKEKKNTKNTTPLYLLFNFVRVGHGACLFIMKDLSCFFCFCFFVSCVYNRKRYSLFFSVAMLCIQCHVALGLCSQ